MSPENFCYWLQGKLELDETEDLDEVGLTYESVERIKRHLNLVFKRITLENTQTIAVSGGCDTVTPGGVDSTGFTIGFDPNRVYSVC